MASWVDQFQAVSSAYTVISEVIFVFVLQRWQINNNNIVNTSIRHISAYTHQCDSSNWTNQSWNLVRRDVTRRNKQTIFSVTLWIFPNFRVTVENGQASCERTALCVWRHRNVCSTAPAAPPMRLPITNPNPNPNPNPTTHPLTWII